MLSIAATPSFVADADRILSVGERLEDIAWIAANPEAGDVVRGRGGCRKVRWQRAGTGKRGGARAIYFVRTDAGELWMLVACAKALKGSIPGCLLKEIRRELDKGRRKKRRRALRTGRSWIQNCFNRFVK